MFKRLLFTVFVVVFTIGSFRYIITADDDKPQEVNISSILVAFENYHFDSGLVQKFDDVDLGVLEFLRPFIGVVINVVNYVWFAIDFVVYFINTLLFSPVNMVGTGGRRKPFSPDIPLAGSLALQDFPLLKG